MQVTCFQCGAPVAAADVNIQQAIAKCSQCQAVFKIGGGERARPKRQVEQPRGFSIRHLQNEVEITYRWFSMIVFVLIGIAVFWNGITWTMIVAMIATGQFEWFLGLFMTPFALIGLGLIYSILTYFFNATVIRATPHEFTVRHGPLPWFGNRRLDPANIGQLSCHEHVSHGKDGSTTTYELHAHMLDGSRIKLLRGMPKPEQVRYLEQELEHALAIEDRPVTNELH